MERPDQEAIEMFMSITGASKPVAVRRLVEHAGNLNQAVNAHFSEGDRNITQVTSVAEDQDNLMDIDDPTRDESRGPPYSVLPSARTLNPFSLLDSDPSISAFDSGSDSSSTGRLVSRRREVREIPVVVKDGTEQSGHSGLAPTIEDSSGTANRHGSEIHDTVIIDDEDEEDILTAPITGVAPTYAHVTASRPSAPAMDDLPDYRNDIEEEMVRAAIEASKRDSEISYSDQKTSMPAKRQSHIEDPELAHAVSLSLKTAEQEKPVHNLGEKVGPSDSEDLKSSEMEDPGKLANGRLEVGGSSTQDEAEDIEDHPLVRHRSRRMSFGYVDSDTEIGDTEVNPPSSPQHDTDDHSQHNETDIGLAEWGGISSLEHDEAVMLEAALFGGIPEGSAYHVPYAPRQFMQNGLDGTGGYPLRAPRPPSPSLTAQRLIREQQDDEYLASLQADREKELKAREEAEIRLIEEQAAREAALGEERQKEEDSRRKLQEEQEMERQLATKEACIPPEPSPDDENAVTLLVRMPDGSRRGRRFLKSHRLQYLFDYIDVGRQVKPGTYRLVRPYPRRAFGDVECTVTFNELGLTSRQEALFLELI